MLSCVFVVVSFSLSLIDTLDTLAVSQSPCCCSSSSQLLPVFYFDTFVFHSLCVCAFTFM